MITPITRCTYFYRGKRPVTFLLLALVAATLLGCASGPAQPPLNDSQTHQETQPDSSKTPQQKKPESEADNSSDDHKPESRAKKDRFLLPSDNTEQSAPLAAVSQLMQEGWRYFDSGQWNEAIAVAERGLRIQRRVAELYLILGRSYLALGNAKKARAFAHQGIRYSQSRQGAAVRVRRLLEALLAETGH